MVTIPMKSDFYQKAEDFFLQFVAQSVLMNEVISFVIADTVCSFSVKNLVASLIT
jgi:hypothetical protein